jgi:hypothetical protein
VALAGGVDSGIEGGGIRVAAGEGLSFLARRCMMETLDAWEGESISGEQIKDIGRRSYVKCISQAKSANESYLLPILDLNCLWASLVLHGVFELPGKW